MAMSAETAGKIELGHQGSNFIANGGGAPAFGESTVQHIRQLERLASLGTMAAGIGHEIRNALVAAKTFFDLLLEKHQDAELTEIVRREINRIDALASQMLRFASPAEPSFCPVHLHEVLDHSLRLLQHQFDSRGIKLERSYAAEADLIGGDDYQLEQAFVNLFLNALEAMSDHGELQIQTAVVSPEGAGNGGKNGGNQPRLRVTIKDTGIGISSQNMEHLFEPFFTTKPNGTGLGLLITKRIIQEHQGEISVKSEPNHGAVFTILLPALKE